MPDFGLRKRSKRVFLVCSAVGVVVLGGAIAVASGAYPTSGVTVYTGCLSSGTIVKVAPNPTKPLHACSPSQPIVHLSGGTITSITPLPGGGLAGGGSNGAVKLGLAAAYQLPQGCTVGQIAKSNGSGTWTCGDAMTPRVFSSSGTYTVPAGVKWVEVLVWGAGGGGGGPLVPGTTGGSSGGGGGSGAGLLSVSSCGTVAVTVGAGGAGGSGGGVFGQDGGSSSAACNGGSIGATGGSGDQGQGGTGGGPALGGGLPISGLYGGEGGAGNSVSGARGGGSEGGSGGTSASDGLPGGISGGGGGAGPAGLKGGNGGNGLVLIIPSA